jgi:vacuolar-type H+-ATPase subunit H
MRCGERRLKRGGQLVAMLQGWLQRFRLAEVPGAPATAGVPMDEASRLEGELRPLLALLAEAQQRTQAVEQEFDLRSRQLLDDARAQAAGIVSEAHLNAAAEREHTIAEAGEAARREREDLLQAARTEAERVRLRSAQVLPGLVEQATDLVLAPGPPRP